MNIDKKLINLYKNLLENDLKNYKKEVYTFYNQRGKNYKNTSPKILFIGKAVNNWITTSRKFNVLFGKDSQEKIINRNDEMLWLSEENNKERDYNINRSAFWRVIREVSREILKKEDWYNHIAWTNLYKIAPEGDNPNKYLQDIQKEKAVEILDEERKSLNPDFVIFLTSDWERFYINSLNIPKKEISSRKWGKYSTDFFQKNDVTYILSKHPQGKKEQPHKNILVKIIQENRDD